MYNTDVENLIIGGDWNVTLQSLDKRGGIPWKASTYRDSLISMMEELELIDVFRKQYPRKPCFSYESKALKVSSRIDFFLVARPLTNWVLNIETKASNAPDHKAIKLTLKPLGVKRGPGLWKFNNSLVEDEEYVKLIKENYPIIGEKYRELEDKRLCWELIKMEIRGLTIAYSKNKAKKQRKSESDLQIRLEELDKQIADSTDSALTNNALTEKEILKQKLQLFYERKANGLILRSKARWTEKGEKPTKYFFNLEKRNYIRKKISELELSDGKPSCKEDEILKEIEHFYEKLYTSKGNIDDNRFENFVRNLELPKLRDLDKEELEGEITMDECKEVLKSFSSGKSPGEDGFTWEFYNCFFDLLGEDLINCYNAAYKTGEMSISQRRGTITLIPKEDSNLLNLANWRPITLLNLDYKIASKAIAKRIEKVLTLLINPDQTGFIKGRYIGQNVRLLNDILEQTETQNIPGILLQLDFRKAFDTIEWEFIQKTLALFNFGESIQRWISTFYTNPESSVLNNGFCTNSFKLSRGVRQGCPLSPYLFILSVEILACKIRQDKEIEGIRIFKKEIKISQFADDTSLLCSSCKSVQRAIEVLNDFGDVSGLRLNPTKTKALWLGPWRDIQDEPFEFQWPKDPIRALGIFISYHQKQNERKNFKAKIDKLSTILDLWQSRSLTLFGRSLISKSLGISQLVYSISILDTPPECIKDINSLIFRFIWKKKQDKIKRKVMALDYKNGGLRAPSIEVMVKSLKLAWISRLLKNEQSCDESWKVIPNHFLNKYGGLNFLLRCNYNEKFLKGTTLPLFYRSILQYFLELKTAHKCVNGQELVLFNNKDILIENQTIFHKDWFQKEIFLIQDLLKDDGKFFTYPEFVRRYELKCNFLTYMQVVSAIPKHLVKKAREKHLDKSTFLAVDAFQLSPNTVIDLLKMKNKDYYWLLINKDNQEIKAEVKWSRDLHSEEFRLDDLFSRVKNVCKENKMREFYFKLIHRIVVTKKELFSSV